MRLLVRLALVGISPWAALFLIVGVTGMFSPSAPWSPPLWIAQIVMPLTAILVLSGSVITPAATILSIGLLGRLLIRRSTCTNPLGSRRWLSVPPLQLERGKA